MTRASETTRKSASQSQTARTLPIKATADAAAQETAVEQMHRDVLVWLDEAKAEEIVSIDIKEKSSIGDYMMVATGRSDRHVGAIADQVLQKLKEAGMTGVRIEGQQTCDWVVVDAGAIIVHVFRPEVREFYNIEKMWQAERPPEPTVALTVVAVLVTLAAVGKLKAGPDQELFHRYWDRLKAAGRTSGITSLRVVELPESRAQSVDERKADEGARLLKAVAAEAFIVALDERGKSLTSPQFAASLGGWCGGGRKELALMIGGPDGHAPLSAERARICRWRWGR